MPAPPVACLRAAYSARPAAATAAAAAVPLGSRVATISLFFGVCSGATNSLAVTLYPFARKIAMRIASVTRAAASDRRPGIQ